MFESLSDRLLESFKNLKGEGSITELNVADTVKDIRKALLEETTFSPTALSRTLFVKSEATV